MTTELDRTALDRALGLVAKVLELGDAQSVRLLICGGSALLALGLVERTTGDVDVLALLDEDDQLLDAVDLPISVQAAAARVAADLGLPSDWLNMGPKLLTGPGLPEGCLERIEPRRYGDRLTACFVSRLDQVHFKLYAAADQGPGRHAENLVALRPAPAELLAASRWAMRHDPSEEFRSVLLDMLRALDHEEVAAQL